MDHIIFIRWEYNRTQAFLDIRVKNIIHINPDSFTKYIKLAATKTKEAREIISLFHTYGAKNRFAVLSQFTQYALILEFSKNLSLQ